MLFRSREALSSGCARAPCGGQLYSAAMMADVLRASPAAVRHWVRVGLLAPAGTPRALVTQVNRDVHAVIDEPRMREQFISRGFEMSLSTPDEFARYIRTEIPRWIKVARDAGLTK